MPSFSNRYGRNRQEHQRRKRKRRSARSRQSYARKISTTGGYTPTGHKKYNNYNMYSLREQVNYLTLLNKVNTQSIFYGYREANEISDGLGKQILKTDITTGDELPFHIYPLRNVKMAGTGGSGCLKLNADGHDFTAIGSPTTIEYLGSKGNTIQDGESILFRKILCNYHDIKIMLWGEADRKTTFEVLLVKFFDEEFDPALLPVVTDANTQKKRVLLFKDMLLRPMITNPVIAGEVISNSIKKEMKILWRKKYKLRETLSTEDQRQHKLIKIFKKCHEVLDYYETPQTETVANYLNADEIVKEDILNVPSNTPTTPYNLFLIILGNCHAEDETQTYDINIKSKYTLLAEHTQS